MELSLLTSMKLLLEDHAVKRMDMIEVMEPGTERDMETARLRRELPLVRNMYEYKEMVKWN